MAKFVNGILPRLSLLRVTKPDGVAPHDEKQVGKLQITEIWLLPDQKPGLV